MIELHIKGMHCTACVSKIEEALYLVEGVTKAVAKLDKNKAIVARAENIAVNSPIQGSAADLIKIAMIKIAKELGSKKMQSSLLLQIHDELVLESPKEEVEEVSQMVRQCMEGALELRVPLKVDLHTGKNWHEAH